MRIPLMSVVRCAAVAAALVGTSLAANAAAAQVSHGDEADHAAEGHDHAAADDHAAAEPNPLGFDLDLAVWTLVVFILLFLVLKKFAWPQIVLALEERERNIAENIAAAEARHEDAKRLLAEHEAKLAAAAGEVRALLEEARRDAEHTRKMIADKGHQDAQDELKRALREIGRAKDAAVQELAHSSANVAIDLARKVVREQLTAEQQSQLVRDALGKLSAASPSKN
jgi:F-type H+-transporting ATPase subunit b